MTDTLLMLLAEADPSSAITPGNVTSVIGIGGAGSFVMWYAWYVTTKLVPMLVEKFANTVDEIRKTFEATINEERRTCAADKEALRDRVHEATNLAHDQTLACTVAVHELTEISKESKRSAELSNEQGKRCATVAGQLTTAIHELQSEPGERKGGK